MSAIGGLSGTKSYGKSRVRGKPSPLRKRPVLNAYMKYQLGLARERVEEEIVAQDFVRGAWRELKKGRGAA